MRRGESSRPKFNERDHFVDDIFDRIEKRRRAQGDSPRLGAAGVSDRLEPFRVPVVVKAGGAIAGGTASRAGARRKAGQRKVGSVDGRLADVSISARDVSRDARRDSSLSLRDEVRDDPRDDRRDEVRNCKERPENSRGKGGSRAFVPWCRD